MGMQILFKNETMIPCNNDGNEITEGDILAQCKMIKIVKVTEVSNHYE